MSAVFWVFHSLERKVNGILVKEKCQVFIHHNIISSDDNMSEKLWLLSKTWQKLKCPVFVFFFFLPWRQKYKSMAKHSPIHIHTQANRRFSVLWVCESSWSSCDLTLFWIGQKERWHKRITFSVSQLQIYLHTHKLLISIKMLHHHLSPFFSLSLHCWLCYFWLSGDASCGQT